MRAKLFLALALIISPKIFADPNPAKLKLYKMGECLATINSDYEMIKESPQDILLPSSGEKQAWSGVSPHINVNQYSLLETDGTKTILRLTETTPFDTAVFQGMSTKTTIDIAGFNFVPPTSPEAATGFFVKVGKKRYFVTLDQNGNPVLDQGEELIAIAKAKDPKTIEVVGKPVSYEKQENLAQTFHDQILMNLKKVTQVGVEALAANTSTYRNTAEKAKRTLLNKDATSCSEIGDKEIEEQYKIAGDTIVKAFENKKRSISDTRRKTNSSSPNAPVETGAPVGTNK